MPRVKSSYFPTQNRPSFSFCTHGDASFCFTFLWQISIVPSLKIFNSFLVSLLLLDLLLQLFIPAGLRLDTALNNYLSAPRPGTPWSKTLSSSPPLTPPHLQARLASCPPFPIASITLLPISGTDQLCPSAAGPSQQGTPAALTYAPHWLCAGPPAYFIFLFEHFVSVDLPDLWESCHPRLLQCQEHGSPRVMSQKMSFLLMVGFLPLKRSLEKYLTNFVFTEFSTQRNPKDPSLSRCIMVCPCLYPTSEGS